MGRGWGKGVWRWGKREIIYISLHCHDQNDSCIKMGSNKSHFNDPLNMRDKVTRQHPQTTTFLKRRESQSRIELRSFCLPLGQTGSLQLSGQERERLCCLMSTEVRRPIYSISDGKRGTEERNLKTGAKLEDQGCRGLPPEQQNVTAVSARPCAATTAPRNCCPNSYAEQSHKDNVRSSAAGKQLKQKKSNSLSLAQHTSLLLISSGLTSS